MLIERNSCLRVPR